MFPDIDSEMKGIINNNLSHYPYLKKLVGNNPQLYEIYRPYLYNDQYREFCNKIDKLKPVVESYCKKVCEFKYGDGEFVGLISKITTQFPWFNWMELPCSYIPDNPEPFLREAICEEMRALPSTTQLRLDTECFGLGGYLWSISDPLHKNNSAYLAHVDCVLKKYPKLFYCGYSERICREFDDMFSEMKVYDFLRHMGFNPIYEPEVTGTKSKPDFCILSNDKQKYFVEVKFRHTSFEEWLQAYDLSEYIPQTGYFSLDDDTRKTKNVIDSACKIQISKFNKAVPDIPVILFVESEADFFGTTVNFDVGSMKERLPNLKAIVLFCFNSNLTSGNLGKPLVNVVPVNDLDEKLHNKLNKLSQIDYCRLRFPSCYYMVKHIISKFTHNICNVLVHNKN